jgi:hypothetical protein
MSSKAAFFALPKTVAWSGTVPLVLHMDNTYKLNINEYPVLVLGISDAQQQFHMLSISVILYHSECMYKDLPRQLQLLLLHDLSDITFTQEYAMIDCDAYVNGFITGFVM